MPWIRVRPSPLLTVISISLVLTFALAAGGSAAGRGFLTQLAAPNGCIKPSPPPTCSPGRALFGASAVAMSPTGTHVYVGAVNSGAVSVFARDRMTGVIIQRPTIDGCIQDSSSSGGCRVGRALFSPVSVAVSPDAGGKHVYVASSEGDGAVAVLMRDLVTGVLTQQAGGRGCLRQAPVDDGCQAARGIGNASSVTVSGDGRNVYVTSDGIGSAVATFIRDRGTGQLTQFAGAIGCVKEVPFDGDCADGKALDGAKSVAMSPEGRHVYVASSRSGAVAVFARARTTGVLSQLAGVDGCIRETPVAGDCAHGRGLAGASAVVVSPDGHHVYVASFDGAIAAFARNRTTGILTQLAGLDGCVKEMPLGGDCAAGKALGGASSVAVSPNGKHVYVAATIGAVAVFARDLLTGALTQLPGLDGCVKAISIAVDCTIATGMGHAASVVLSPKGQHVYVASFSTVGPTGDGVLAFHRD
jgi:DNA-binding beta-propeller fold protein YncE